MKRKKHKRKANHVMIVTSDAVDAKNKQFRVRPWIIQSIVIVVCVFVGAAIGYFAYEEKIWEAANEKSSMQQQALLELEEQKKALESEVEGLKDKITILSETVNQKVLTETQLTEELAKQSLPTEFPLTGSASVEEVTEGDPICIFTASQGTMVVATANGTVTAVNDDGEYGHNVWVEHGNGYVTIYRNQGEVSVQAGDTVARGTTLFLIGEENTKLGYQMMKDGAFINPMDMLAISG